LFWKSLFACPERSARQEGDQALKTPWTKGGAIFHAFKKGDGSLQGRLRFLAGFLKSFAKLD
jgi:hypothetical protein